VDNTRLSGPNFLRPDLLPAIGVFTAVPGRQHNCFPFALVGRVCLVRGVSGLGLVMVGVDCESSGGKLLTRWGRARAVRHGVPTRRAEGGLTLTQRGRSTASTRVLRGQLLALGY
jgi:hypothetical protein